MEDFYGRTVQVGNKILKQNSSGKGLTQCFVAEIKVLFGKETLVTVRDLASLQDFNNNKSVYTESTVSMVLVLEAKGGKLVWSK